MCFVPFCVSSVLVLLLFRTIQVRPSYIGSKVFVSLLPHYFLPLSDRMSGLSVKAVVDRLFRKTPSPLIATSDLAARAVLGNGGVTPSLICFMMLFIQFNVQAKKKREGKRRKAKNQEKLFSLSDKKNTTHRGTQGGIAGGSEPSVPPLRLDDGGQPFRHR